MWERWGGERKEGERGEVRKKERKREIGRTTNINSIFPPQDLIYVPPWFDFALRIHKADFWFTALLVGHLHFCDVSCEFFSSISFVVCFETHQRRHPPSMFVPPLPSHPRTCEDSQGKTQSLTTITESDFGGKSTNTQRKSSTKINRKNRRKKNKIT